MTARQTSCYFHPYIPGEFICDICERSICEDHKMVYGLQTKTEKKVALTACTNCEYRVDELWADQSRWKKRY